MICSLATQITQLSPTPLPGSKNNMKLQINPFRPHRFHYPQQHFIWHDSLPQTVINDFPEKITGVASTPVADHLFKICNLTETCPLPKSHVIAYHHTTAQLMFLSRVCCDIQTKVAFLTTRVKASDEDNWGKLQRVLKYLNGTRYPKLTLLADSLSILHWYVDASHQTHEDCPSHTGTIFTFGKGAITSSLNKTQTQY